MGSSSVDESGPVAVGGLTVFYDEGCALCRRCRDWLLTQRCLVPIQLLPAGAPQVRARYPAVAPWLGRELVAMDERGNAWIGPAAFLTCLWATVRYRPWSYLLARRSLVPLSERFFRFVSRRRGRWGNRNERDDTDCSWCDEIRMEHGV